VPKQLEGVDSERHRRRRTVVLLLLAGLLALVALAAWTGWQVYSGATSLRSAADRLDRLSTDLTDESDLIGQLRAAASDTQAARQRFEDPFVRLAQDLPFVGKPVRAASVISVSADTAVREAALPLAEAAGPRPTDRLVGDGGSIDLPYLVGLAGPASVASATLSSADAALRAAPRRSGVRRLDEARDALDEKLDELQDAVRGLAVTADIGPEMLGQAAARTYFLGVQNPAEARGTGGLVGGYVILEADNGIIRVTASGANTALKAFNKGLTPVASFGPEYDQHYGYASPTAAFVNSNLSPHFPYAAHIWATLWQQQSGQRVDGVLALDPIALSYLLRATGPVPLSNGQSATADNVVELTLKDAYATFDDANAERKEYLQEVTRGVAAIISTGRIDASELLRGLIRAAEERRALLWTPEARIQGVLGEAPVTGRLPAEGPTVGTTIINSAGSKLDYYLERRLTYESACRGRPSRLSLRLTNTAPASGLPNYVSAAHFRPGLPAGTNISTVNIYVPRASKVIGLTMDGRVTPFRQGGEFGLRWVESVVTLRPGATADLVLTFNPPAAARFQVQRFEQPLVRPEAYRVEPCMDLR
jgi:hypothetical protein